MFQGVVVIIIASFISPYLTPRSDPFQDQNKQFEFVSNEINLIREEIKLIRENRTNVYTEISSLNEKIDLLQNRVRDESEYSEKLDRFNIKLFDLLENEISTLKNNPEW